MTIVAPVILDGFQLNADGLDGLDWWVQELAGWWDGPTTFVRQEQRVASSGQFPQEGRRGGRLITVTGQVFAKTTGQTVAMSQARETIAALLADGRFGTFTTNDPSEGERWATVQLLEAPEFAWRGGYDDMPVDMPYQLQLLAPSTYKFGALSSSTASFFTGSPAGVGLEYPLHLPSPNRQLEYNADPDTATGVATVMNAGTASAPVTFSVAGPTADEGFRITDQGTGLSILYYGASVPDGSTIVFNGSNGTVLIDGAADRSGDAIIQAWPTVPAGGSASFLFESFGAATAAVLTASAYATYF